MSLVSMETNLLKNGKVNNVFMIYLQRKLLAPNATNLKS